MRRTVLLLSLTFPVAWVACVSSDNAGPPTSPGLDGSVDTAVPQPDASVADTGSGGGVDATVADAAPEATVPADAPADVSVDSPVDAPADAAPDAPVDAPVDAPPDAATAPVVLTVVGAAGPESNIQVVWGDAAGAVSGASTTNGLGTASASVVPGGMVTVLLGSPSIPTLYTVQGLQPGQQLAVVDWASFTTGLSVNLTAVPPSPPVGTTSTSFSMGPCSGGFTSPPAVVPLTQYTQQLTCVGLSPAGTAAAYPALVEADDTNGNLSGFVFAVNNPLTTLPDDAGNLDLALGGAWSTSTTAQTVVAVNQPEAGVNSQAIKYSEVADGVMLALHEQTLTDGGVLPSGTTLYATHEGYADFVQTELWMAPTVPVGVDGLHIGVALATRAAPPAASGTTTIDWTPLDTMPQLIGTTVDQTSKIAWTTASGTLASVTGIIALALWQGAGNGSWTIVAPGTAQAFLQAPQLPAGSAWTPSVGASFVTSTVYAVQGGTALPTYAQVAAAGSLFKLQTACINPPMAPPLPAGGSLIVSGFTSGSCP